MVPEVQRPWGQHLILDLNGCPPDLLKDGELIRTWCAELVRAIEMKSYGDPLLEHFASHEFNFGGYTIVQLIETSNICAHFAENIGQVYIDVFSCKQFDSEVATAVCRQFFKPTEIRQVEMDRGVFHQLKKAI